MAYNIKIFFKTFINLHTFAKQYLCLIDTFCDNSRNSESLIECGLPCTR